MPLPTVTRKSLLYRSGVKHADFCINHVEGCSHGCTYPCYAYQMKKHWGKVLSYEEWCSPRIVSNSLELLEKEIPKKKNKIQYVHLCFSTDPFMYGQDEIGEMSMKIIRMLNKNDIPVTTLSKGISPVELAGMSPDDAIRISRGRKAGENNCAVPVNRYGISLVSLDEGFRSRFEPNTAPYAERIKALEYLHEKGCRTWVTIEPYPTPNMVEQDLRDILDAIGFVDMIIFGRLNYSTHASGFKHHREFYTAAGHEVIDFCTRKKIDFFIKEKTIT